MEEEETVAENTQRPPKRENTQWSSESSLRKRLGVEMTLGGPKIGRIPLQLRVTCVYVNRNTYQAPTKGAWLSPHREEGQNKRAGWCVLAPDKVWLPWCCNSSIFLVNVPKVASVSNKVKIHTNVNHRETLTYKHFHCMNRTYGWSYKTTKH